jgi:Tol biopolymer transport system component
MKLLIPIILITIAFACRTSQKKSSIAINNIIYPGKPAGDTPEIFAPAIICQKKIREGSISFSPDGNEIVYTMSDSTSVRIMYMKFENNQWTTPEVWEQSNIENNSEAVFSPDGNTLYFISNRHDPKAKGSGKIYRARRTGNHWSQPQLIDLHITTDKGLWFPAATRDEKLFLGAYLDSIGNFGKSDIYEFDLKNDNNIIRNAGNMINSPYEEWDPFISNDGSYMLFESDRPGGFGATDIYISLKKDNAWTTPVNLGPTINTKAYEVAAKVSPDGKYLFFDRPQKTEQDIYWVKATAIDSIISRRTHKASRREK